jgi:membrane-associated protease RseP (regulator of RpoE activity)
MAAGARASLGSMGRWMPVLAGFAAGALAVQLGYGLGSAGREPVTAEPERDALAAELTRLREQLELEVTARIALAADVERLRSALGGASETPEPAAPEGPPAASAQAAPPVGGPPAGALDPAVLVRAGFSESDVAAFRARFDEIELERLYLRDRAIREGWYRSPRYAEESARLSHTFDALRDDFGDELYDWGLFASGQPNRVVVQRVMEGSPAAEAGLRTGDAIVRYDDRRIFQGEELQEATTQGRVGDLVALDVEREGDTERIYVPRGPLGVSLMPRLVPPPPPR